MAGTSEGGKKAAATNKLRYGEDYYRKIGQRKKAQSTGSGFAFMDKEKVRAAGRKGGKTSRRGPARKADD